MEKRDYEGALYYILDGFTKLKGGKIVPLSQSAIDYLQELVKRNEPIKPKLMWKNEEDKNIAVFRCLNCNAMLGVKLDNKPIFPNFCRHCGQKLDWSSEKYD